MDAKEWVEVQAPTVEEAIILGLTRLGITRDEAVIEVLDEGSKGFLGLGSREARVKVRRQEREKRAVETAEKDVSVPAPEGEVPKATLQRTEPKPPAEQPSREESRRQEPEKPRKKESAGAKRAAQSPPAASAPAAKKDKAEDPRQRIEAVVLEVAERLFGALDVEPKIIWREEERRPALWLSLRGADAKSLVGQRGKTLNAAQFLTRVLVRNQIDGNFNLIVDADNYRWRRRKKLQRMARKAADKAIASGQPIRMRPMPARERRIVHMTLRKDRRVRTKSYGSGRGRAVTVFPIEGDR
ncbi:MAG: RNA-binding cell elongation regulator Jag/EloR [Anaerolineae bacterium]